jgi:hypothetical protein
MRVLTLMFRVIVYKVFSNIDLNTRHLKSVHLKVVTFLTIDLLHVHF